MTNWEKYKDTIMKIEGRFALDKNTKKITKCDAHIDCKDCVFNESECFESDKIKWLYEEYKEPALSDDELELIKSINKVLGKEIKYMARDEDNIMRFFETKPKVNVLGNYYSLNECSIHIDVLNGSIFPNIQHKDGLYDIENKCFIKGEGGNKNDKAKSNRCFARYES